MQSLGVDLMGSAANTAPQAHAQDHSRSCNNIFELLLFLFGLPRHAGAVQPHVINPEHTSSALTVAPDLHAVWVWETAGSMIRTLVCGATISTPLVLQYYMLNVL